jgi:hypothetical protein
MAITVLQMIFGTSAGMKSSLLKKKIGLALGGGGAKGLCHIIKPELRNIKALEFYRYAEIMNGVTNDVQHFKDEVSRWIKKRLPFL